MDRLASLAVFVRVVDLGSFSAAAREIGLSPAGVGNHIRALERWTDARLIDRTTRRLGLTEAGHAFLRHARRILDEAEEARSVAASLRAQPKGVLKLSLPVTYGLRVLGPLIAAYMARHAQVQIDAALNDRFVDLVEEGFDLAVRIGTLSDSSLVARRLARARFVLCAAPAYLERAGIPETPADLLRHDCLEHSVSRPRGRWHLTAPDGSPAAIDVTGRLRATSGELLRIAALQGLGLTLAPLFIVGEDVARGDLVPVLTEYGLPEPGIHALRPPGERVPLKVRSFVDFLAERLGEA